MKSKSRKRVRLNLIKVLTLIILIVTVLLIFNYPYSNYNDNIQVIDKIGDANNKNIDESLLVLVNKDNELPSNYNIELIKYNDFYVAAILYNDLIEMINTAKNDGITLVINNAYRSPKEQENIYNDKIKSYKKQGYNQTEAVMKAEETVQKANYSEHHTGLAIDFSLSWEVNELMWSWLKDNAYKYGFILRYPSNKVHITKINYEAWHYRYVGYTHAKEIYDSKLTLEEYLMNR